LLICAGRRRRSRGLHAAFGRVSVARRHQQRIPGVSQRVPDVLHQGAPVLQVDQVQSQDAAKLKIKIYIRFRRTGANKSVILFYQSCLVESI